MTLQSLGIVAETFPRLSLEANLDAVARYRFPVVNYNTACAGLPSLPEHIPVELASRIRIAAAARGIRIAAVSGASDMFHPDIEMRRNGLRALRVLATACSALGTRCITLCTGTRDIDDMWRGHPGNDAPDAWLNLLEVMEEAADIAEQFDILLGIEPANTNVVDSAAKARLLLREMRSPNLKIVLDPASLLRPSDLARQREIMEDAIDLLGPHIIMAHAQDVRVVEGEIQHVAVGTGLLDYPLYLSLLQELRVPLIVRGLSEADVSWSIAFLRATIEGADRHRLRAG